MKINNSVCLPVYLSVCLCMHACINKGTHRCIHTNAKKETYLDFIDIVNGMIELDWLARLLWLWCMLWWCQWFLGSTRRLVIRMMNSTTRLITASQRLTLHKYEAQSHERNHVGKQPLFLLNSVQYMQKMPTMNDVILLDIPMPNLYPNRHILIYTLRIN